MRIAYGIHGYGRGHATRAMGVLPGLMARHDVLVMAGGDAYNLLKGDYSVERIPSLAFQSGKGGGISFCKTAVRSAPAMVDVFCSGPALEWVMAIVRDFKPDVVVVDAEVWTHRAAARLGVPRIGFDHFGILVYCKPPLPPRDRLSAWFNAFSYRRLMGQPERVIVSSFYDAPPRRPGLSIVGPLLRDEVLQTAPSDGEHLLAYLNKGRSQLTSRIEEQLGALGCPVLVYGMEPQGPKGNLVFRPLANRPFVEDLANCRAVVSTAGNQLVGETMHFGKPILVMPENTVEQRLNAAGVERLGVGMSTTFAKLTAGLVRDFLAKGDEYRANIARVVKQGWKSAGDVLERYVRELGAGA